MDLNKQVESESQVRHTAPLDDRILTLRRAIFDASGADKDVTQGIAASFMKYNNGSPVTIEFSTSLSAAEARWAFSATKKNMEARYEASGYGWDDDDKKKELTEKGARFLLVRAAPTPTPTPTTTGAEDVEATEPGPLVGFVHFRFTVQGEVLEKMAGDNCLHVFDIHLEEGAKVWASTCWSCWSSSPAERRWAV
ncbi:hypothetical protein B484DRAFT_99283 [Ochromonadaceae sp. CCMP2298]|nr:hypothetical protein B484DRAFT_99283 [Ochromonadaceae sp. CCMP2298]